MASVGDLLTDAEGYLGIPYVYGGTSPKDGFDCSGLVQYVFGQVGIHLPRTSQEQATSGIKISYSDLSPGDLIFSDWGDGLFSHVAIYAGNGRLIEAPRPGKKVQLVPFDDNYNNHVDMFRRVTSKQTGKVNVVTAISAGAHSTSTSSSSSSGGLLSWPGDMVGFFKDAAGAVESTTQFAAAFFQPSTYVRIGAGLLGTVLLGAGLVFLVWGAAQ